MPNARLSRPRPKVVKASGQSSGGPEPMMPVYVLASLISIDGNSCGVLDHILQRVDGSDPLMYKEILGGGDFPSCCRLTRMHLGGGVYTWELVISYSGGGDCDGDWWFRRTATSTDMDNYSILYGKHCMWNDPNLDCGSGGGEASISQW